MTYDVVVAGGGPAGSAAAWRAASAGAKVLVVDKAKFPRDKPCGDGLTPRAVASIGALGLENELKKFNRIDTLRAHGAGQTLNFSWPRSDTLPDHGYVVARTDLDEMLIRHAVEAGAELREETAARAPIIEDGLTRGLVVRSNGADEEIRAPMVIAADGASSKVSRALGMVMDPRKPMMALAVRAHFDAKRPAADDTVIESFLDVRGHDTLLPGYGWVFPMGGSRINIGVGILSTYKRWRDVNTAHLMEAFMRSLPRDWELPDISHLRESGMLKGSRLPMGFAISQPWRPGVLAAGDAAGVVNPFNGEGISEAIDSGMMSADVALAAIGSGDLHDLSAYQRLLDETWGPYYRLARTFVRLIGNPRIMWTLTQVGMRIPPVMEFAFKLLANIYCEQGGGFGDALVRAMLRAASVIRLG